jgi:hypothetical protein
MRRVLVVALPVLALALAGGIVLHQVLSGPLAAVPGSRSHGAPRASGGGPRVITSGGMRPKVAIGQFFGTEPSVIGFSADGASVVTGIRWTSWDAASATGTGTWHHETCVPTCGTGPVAEYPAELRFSNVRDGMFTVLTTRWNGQVATWYYPSGWPQQAARRPAGPSGTPSMKSPRLVFEAFIAAINQHNWPRVWSLGGKNLGPSYRQMVAGFSNTSHDVVTSLSVSGDTVSASIIAYETTGAAQIYDLTYVITGGVVTAGQQVLVGTSG